MPSGISISTIGDWSKTFSFLKRMRANDPMKVLDECGKQGVAALAAATPKDSGLTADSWTYEIVHTGSKTEIVWSNTNVVDGWFNVAVGLQYGHGTGSGGYVEGIDYVNPALRPVFENIVDTVWKVVVSS